VIHFPYSILNELCLLVTRLVTPSCATTEDKIIASADYTLA